MNYKNLTDDQLLGIASIVDPGKTYKVVKDCPNKWEGYDLISEDNTIIQIDYVNNEITYFDEGLFDYPVVGEKLEKVNNFLKTQ